MTRYGIIRGGVCVNAIISEAEFAAELGAVELAEGYGIGDLYQEGQWSHPEIAEPEPTLEERLEELETNKAEQSDLDALSAAIERGLSL